MMVTEGCAPASQQQNTQHAEPDDVAGLAQIVMEDEEAVEIDLAEQARQQCIQHTAGMLGREKIGRLKRNQPDPDKRWPPGAQKIGATRSQYRSLPLFSRVIRSLARDHEIAHGALAQ